MKILFALQDIPFPISDGMRWKMFYLLKYLSERHQCDILAFSDSALNFMPPTEALPHVNWLGFFQKNKGVRRFLMAIMYIFRGKPPSMAIYANRSFDQRLDQIISKHKYDVLHCDVFNMAQYWREDIATVHSPNDATSLFFKKTALHASSFFVKVRYIAAAFLIFRYEAKYYPRFDAIHVVSKIDADYLRFHNVNKNIFPIPFGVPDASGLQNDYLNNHKLQVSKDKILILGGANAPSISDGIKEFYKICIPKILNACPDAKFHFQGRGTEELIQKLGASDDINITASNWINDLNSLIQQSTIVILPDRTGTGIKTRALQALACGSVVIGTSIAFEGLQDFVTDKVDCIISKDISGITDAVIFLLANKSKCSEIRSAAVNLTKSSLSMASLLPEYEAMYRVAVLHHHQLRLHT